MTAIDHDLARLAAHYGVATSYRDWAGRPVAVTASTVAAVLAQLGVDATRPAAELARAEQAAAHALLPPTVVHTAATVGRVKLTGAPP
ncbi:MAG: 4-alpha-glucanotransferase, partial [Mycobacteriales bacterium]